MWQGMEKKKKKEKNMKTPRPLRAIRLKCLDCSGWGYKEVELCEHKSCVLYELRFGKKPKGLKYEKLDADSYQNRLLSQ